VQALNNLSSVASSLARAANGSDPWDFGLIRGSADQRGGLIRDPRIKSTDQVM